MTVRLVVSGPGVNSSESLLGTAAADKPRCKSLGLKTLRPRAARPIMALRRTRVMRMQLAAAWPLLLLLPDR
eukprot:COSAG01_NODE_24659_length_771_cov_1.383929_1_plen_71_part_10